jgi:hypothetical protein
MRTDPSNHLDGASTPTIRMAEFDEVAASRSVGDILRDNLESAQAQLRLEQRLAGRAERRVLDLRQAVENWHELIDDYERITGSTLDARRN